MSNRATRLGEQIRMEVSEILARKVHDPGVGFVTVTRVRVTQDLLQARVYYTTLDDRRQTARALDRALPFVRRSLGQRLRLRRVPELTFVFDESIAHQARVEELLQEIRQQDSGHADDQLPETEPDDDSPDR